MKFKTGEKYIITSGEREKGNTIEIVGINKYDKLVHYKTIKGFGPNLDAFDNDSYFAMKLKRVKDADCIVIYRKDNDVIAINKSTNKKAIATCGPDDTFDFNVGAKLAFDRLIGKDEPKEKFYDGKVVFNKNQPHEITGGKLYEINNGKIKTDDGVSFPLHLRFRTIDDLKAYFGDDSTGGYCGKWFNSIYPLEVMEIVKC